jgi:type IV secretory pathway VirB9-like protein
MRREKMKRILISALSLPVLALLAYPCFAADEVDSMVPVTVTSTPVTPVPMTPKERVQAAVEQSQAAPKPLAFSRKPASTAAGLGNNILSSDTVALSAKELRALELSQNWAQSGPAPFLSGGKLTYIHGAGGIPAIIAAPMQIVDVELEPGETINEIVAGDSARWLVEMGTAGNTTHLFIKPVDVGLESSLAVTTDRRVYHLRLD